MNPKNKYNIELVKEIISDYQSGMSQKEIAIKNNTYNTTIRRILLRENILIIGNSIRQRKVKTSPFKNNRESYYFLGLLIADGCISNKRITLGLQEKDLYILERFCDFLGYSIKINKYFATAHNKYQYQVNFRQPDVVNWLQQKANFVNKSFEAALYIPMTWDILRGIFDGDGSVVLINKSLRFFICGKAPILMYQIRNFLVSCGYHPTINTDKTGLITVNLYRKSEITRLFQELYEDTDLFLNRKHQIMATFVEKSMK